MHRHSKLLFIRGGDTSGNLTEEFKGVPDGGVVEKIATMANQLTLKFIDAIRLQLLEDPLNHNCRALQTLGPPESVSLAVGKLGHSFQWPLEVLQTKVFKITPLDPNVKKKPP